MHAIRGLFIFSLGMLAGVLIMEANAAPQQRETGLRLNHVGMYVKNFDQSMSFYTKVMGFHEAFSIKDKDGKPALAYLQISRDTFLELAPADAQHPLGFSHVGIWADDVRRTVKAVRQKDVQIDDAHVGATKALLTNLADPNGLALEILQYGPESLQRKAMDSWK